MKNGGKADYKFTDVVMGSSKHRTKKEAEKALKSAIAHEKDWKENVLKRSKQQANLFG